MILFLIAILVLTIGAISLFIAPMLSLNLKRKHDKTIGRIYIAIILFSFTIITPVLYANYGKPLQKDLPLRQRDILKSAENPTALARLKLLERYLNENPNDGVLWFELATLYRQFHFYSKATSAYRNAIEWGQSEDITNWHALAETVIQENNGKITGEAQKALENVLRYRPDDAKAIYFLGLARLQNKEPQKAIAMWRYLEQILLSEDPWLSVVHERISKTQEALKIDPLKVKPQAPAPLNL